MSAIEAIEKECSVPVVQADSAPDKIRANVTKSRLRRRKEAVIKVSGSVILAIIGKYDINRQRNPTGCVIGNMAYTKSDEIL